MTVQKILKDDKAAVVQMISNGRPLKETLIYILKKIENYCDSDKVFGSIMLYDSVLNKLGNTISPSLPKNFINAIEPVEISPYGGSSGAAAYLKRPVFVSDIEYNPLWEKYRHIAIVHGFRACFSMPLYCSKQTLLGTIDLYSNQIGVLDERIFKLVEIFSELASLAIEVYQNNNVHLLYSMGIDNRLIEETEQNCMNFIQR